MNAREMAKLLTHNLMAKVPHQQPLIDLAQLLEAQLLAELDARDEELEYLKARKDVHGNHRGGLNNMDVTSREDEIMVYILRGMSNKVIAYELGVAENTVKVHVRNVFRKLGASNRTHAAMLYRTKKEQAV